MAACTGLSLQQTTSSTLTGKYFVSKAEVRRMMHRLTRSANSFNFSWPFFCWSSVASASLPRRIADSNLFLNSWAVPRRPWLTKWTKLKYSRRSFWMGVPERSTRRLQFRATRAWYVWFSLFFNRWPCRSRYKALENSQKIITALTLNYLITKHQSDFTLVKLMRVQSKCFVGNYEDRAHYSATISIHEALQVAINFILTARVNN